VSSSRHSAAGTLHDEERHAMSDAPNEPEKRREEIRRNLTQTLIAQPLLDAVLDPSKANTPYDVIINPNLDYEGGRANAIKHIETLIDRVRRDGEPDPKVHSDAALHPYVFARLTARAIVELARMDSADSNQDYEAASGPGKQRLARVNRAIYRIWEDPDISPLIINTLATVKADAAHAAFAADGKDIIWAVIDSGIDKSHPHFLNLKNLELPQPLQHCDFTDSNSELIDDFGHGTHVAGIIAGVMHEQEKPSAVIRSRDEATGVISSTVLPLEREVSGMAPRCKLISLKVLDGSGKGKASSVIRAIAYVQKLNDFGRRVIVHGVNLSVGYPFMPEWFACGQSPLCEEVNRLVKSGVVVVVAAGNSGYGTISAKFGGINAAGIALTINDPGNAELAVTVGSTHRDMPHTYGVSYFSSKGPTGDGRMKPDIVAPGERILSCATGKTKSDAAAVLAQGPSDFQYVEDSGTSMAAPHVSGVIAGFLSIRREFIGNPEAVKKLFMDTATDLNRERSFQGRGLIDLMRAIQAV
jgi:serine protease AprX